MINYMTIETIEDYLSKKNICLDSSVLTEIIIRLNKEIALKHESQANYYWYLKQIYRIQNGFLSAIRALKNKKYEDAWLKFDDTDLKICILEDNFSIDETNDKYHIAFICRMIKAYQKLFPYRYLFSRENVIKSEKCSICGKPISFRHPCGHKVGKLYMGKICCRIVTNMEFKGLSIVTDPYDKYSYVKLPDKEYNYGMLEKLMSVIKSPYDEFYVKTIKVKLPKYRNVSLNALCPCGSRKKYKRCHLGKSSELMEHHKVIFKNKGNLEERFIGDFSTWK